MKKGRLFCPHLAQGVVVPHFGSDALKSSKKGQKRDSKDLTIS